MFREKQGVQASGNGDFTSISGIDEGATGVLAGMKMAINTHNDAMFPLSDRVRGDKKTWQGRQYEEITQGDRTQ